VKVEVREGTRIVEEEVGEEASESYRYVENVI